MNSLAVMLGVLAVLSTACGVKWKDCGSKEGKVTNVVVVGCSVDECPLKKGTNVTFEVDFTSNEAATKASAVVHGIIAGVPIPFHIDNPDGCKNCNLQCPLSAGKAYQYKTSIYVDPSYPKLRLVVKWELKDENQDDLFCVELPAAIVDSALRFQPNN